MLSKISTKMVPPCFESKDDRSPQAWTLDCGTRLNLFTGDNGLGKTVLLDLVWYCLTADWFKRPIEPFRASLPDPEVEEGTSSIKPGGWRDANITGDLKVGDDAVSVHSYYDFEKEEWLVKRADVLPDSIVIYASANGTYGIWDKYRTPVADGRYDQKPMFGSGRDSKRPESFKFTSEDVLYGIREGKTVWCRGLINDWALWKYDPSARRVFQTLQSVLDTLSNDSERMQPGPIERKSAIDAEEYPTVRLPYGNIPIHHLSSGMRRIVEIAYLTVWAWKESLTVSAINQKPFMPAITVIIDEVELHLHPKWQRTVLPSLLEAVKSLSWDSRVGSINPNVQFFATSHSPLVLASLESLFDTEQDRVTVLEYEDAEDSIRLVPYGMAKMGDASSWLTSGVFNMSSARSTTGEKALIEARAYLRGKSEVAVEQIERLLLNSIPDADPFWVVWNLHKYSTAGDSKSD